MDYVSDLVVTHKIHEFNTIVSRDGKTIATQILQTSVGEE